MEDFNEKTSPEVAVNKAKKEVAEEVKPRSDRHIWGVIIFLMLVSVISLYSASSREVASSANVYGPILRHGVMLVAGLLIMNEFITVFLNPLSRYLPLSVHL